MPEDVNSAAPPAAPAPPGPAAPAPPAPAAPAPPAPAPPAPAPVPPPSPAETLKDLKSKLEKNLGDSADLAKAAAGLKEQMADLQKVVDQNASTGKTYGSAVKGLTQQHADLQAYHDTKKTMLEATLKDKKDAVVKAKQDGDKEVADLQTNVDDLKKKISDEDATAYAAAQDDTVQQQAAYDKVAAIPSRGTFWINDLTSLRAAAESQKNQSRAYSLLLEMEDSFKKTNLPSTDDYAKQLDDATAKLVAAKNTERNKKQVLDQDTADLQQAQKAVVDASTKRRDKILKSIPDEAAPAG